MATPSSQVIATWVKTSLDSSEWTSLEDVCRSAIRINWPNVSDTELYDLVEQNLRYVAEHLRNEASEWRVDGITPLFEIDEEPTPYIRVLEFKSKELLGDLRKIRPYDFEHVCARVLRALGADAQVTQPTNDGGVDFIALNLKIVPKALGLPLACMASVIGQAKRYKEGNSVRETNLREFVGAAVRRRHDLQREGKIGPLTPVIYAYWTTSDFDQGAKQYARAIGLWYMEGRTLSDYVAELGLTNDIEDFLASAEPGC